jgi:hypothetical protein
MRIVRVAGLSLCAAATSLAGCATSLEADAPAGSALAGNWKLDPTASDDPQKLLEQMRREAFKIINRHAQQLQQQPVPGDRSGNAPPPEESALFGAGPDGRRPDPLKRSPMAHVIMASVARGDFLTVRSTAGQFVLDYGTSVRSFTPGGHSVVSTEDGVGDQTSGWKNRSYVIVVKQQYGPTVSEEYAPGPDGKSLLETLRLSSGELPSVSLKRVYQPTTEIAPKQLPTTD